MKHSLPAYRLLHIVGAMVALVLHGSLAVWAIQPEAPIVISEQQVIKVSMVAPTVMKQKQTTPKIEKLSAVPPKPKGMLKQEAEKPKPPQREVKQKTQQDETQMQQLTSGVTSTLAKDRNSALTKPIAADYLNNPPPSYPEKARIRKQQGTVLLDVLVSTEGKPKSVKVHKSSGYTLLDQAALSTVRRWQFVAARRGSQRVEASVEIPIIFKIN